jgi:hypothetical protein
MKSLKFRPYLVPKVLSGEKHSTWRLFDDKDIQQGEEVELLEFVTNRHFADARVSKVIEKPFGDLTAADKEGHEEFATDEEMYQVYSTYYKTDVTPDTPVKIIWFELKK